MSIRDIARDRNAISAAYSALIPLPYGEKVARIDGCEPGEGVY
jgi:hypothetical protein